ncbi:solute carrier family 35 member G2a [Kryptolebias marmoratus]|uniref:solute carrier family 35 member G2a n=1 Tax=Kryptolebias marmoratus TaxID=37003 RepID=UPI0007F8E0AA|nr:solute carrier family 35 member G2a [Kryptolebias marmoratus]XP_037833625.1 solute carrier family 35 member G2a [Kryptolebias marmoratus]XP_037833626.1 solute carrier family 35 member G2a [Kryptolebias marmoratus]XP_037833627.1 solute carrier family 35 member G2a [Kryptolebias marmoratus]XP_037833628.1 solute carrier family 35 member G2a [Kryptolebias marmoratus]
MESTHLLSGSKKRVKIHPHTVTAKYATQTPYTPQPGIHTHFPQPGDEGYDDAPSFEDFGSFVEETSDRKRLTEGRKWSLTLFGSKEKEKNASHKLQPPGGGEPSEGGAKAVKGSGKGVGEQLASFGEASVSASRLTWLGLFGAALAHGCLIALTCLALEHFGLGPLFLLLVRSVIQLLSLAVPLYRGQNPFGPEGYRLCLLCYGVAYSLSLCCAYSSLTFVSPGNGTTTWRLATTALSATLAFLLLEERLGLADGITLAAGLCGLGLLLLPNTDESFSDSPVDPVVFWKDAFGWSLSALAGLWMALALVGYRSLKDRVGVGTALFTVSWTGCLLTPATLALIQEGWSWPVSAPAWGLILGLVACSTAAFLGMTHALTRLHPALVSASQSLEVPIAMLLHLAMLPSIPTAPEVVGNAMIVLSVGWLVAMKLLPPRAGGRHQRKEYEEILESPIK